MSTPATEKNPPEIRLPRWFDWVGLLAALGALTLAWLVYAPSLKNGFVWDDHALIERDPLIRSWRLVAEGFQHFLFLDATPSNFYRPIQRLTYTADYHFWGLEPFGYHLSNLLLHAAAGWMLFQFTRRLGILRGLPTGRIEVAAGLLAGLWLVHPVHQSAVAYAAGRADLLAATALFASLTIGIGATTRAGSLRVGGLLAGAVWLLIATLSKEAGLSGLLLFPLFLIWIDPKRWPLPVAFVGGVTTGYLALRQAAVHSPFVQSSQFERLPDAMLRALAEYAGLLLAPLSPRMERDSRLASDAGQSEIWQHGLWVAGGVGLAALAFIALGVAVRRNRPWAPAAVAAVVTYLPISGLQPLNATMAEHWLYLPSAFGAVAIAIAGAGSTWPRRWMVSLLLAGLIWGIGIGGRTRAACRTWKNDQTFFETTRRDGGATARVYLNLALLAIREGQMEAAERLLAECIRLAPDLAFARINRGNLAYRKGQHAEARSEYLAAWDEPLTRSAVLINLAQSEWKESGIDQSSRLLQAARIDPFDWPTHRRLILWFGSQGRWESAYEELAGFLQRQDFRAESWMLLGELFEQVRQPARALEAYEQAAALDTHHQPARAALNRLSD